jgi:hypothetical protein
MSEKDLYVPIKDYFSDVLAFNFNIDINCYVTDQVIPQEILNVSKSVQEVENQYNYKPDLMFYIPSSNEIGIIEVKDDPLNLNDIYQAKRYSEIIEADYSFLISDNNFLNDDDQLIKNTEMSHIFNYYTKHGEDFKKRFINVGIIEEIIESIISEIRFINSLNFGEKIG